MPGMIGIELQKLLVTAPVVLADKFIGSSRLKDSSRLPLDAEGKASSSRSLAIMAWADAQLWEQVARDC